jgi:hypothetical protein
MTASNIRVSGCFRRKYRNVCRYSWVDSNHRVRGSLRHQFNSPWYVAAIDGVPPDAVLHDEDIMRAPRPRSDPAPKSGSRISRGQAPLLRNRRWCVFGLGAKFLPMVCPERFAGQIEMPEVPDFAGAPEEIRTPDPRFVVWCPTICLRSRISNSGGCACDRTRSLHQRWLAQRGWGMMGHRRHRCAMLPRMLPRPTFGFISYPECYPGPLSGSSYSVKHQSWLRKLNRCRKHERLSYWPRLPALIVIHPRPVATAAAQSAIGIA